MDTDYYVPIKIETKRFVRGAEREFVSTLGDYKEVAGVYLPHSLEISTKGRGGNPEARLREDRGQRCHRRWPLSRTRDKAASDRPRIRKRNQDTGSEAGRNQATRTTRSHMLPPRKSIRKPSPDWRPQHRLGGHERSRGGAGCGSGRKAADRLHRGSLGRRLEIGEQRHYLQTGVRQAACPIHRRDCD